MTAEETAQVQAYIAQLQAQHTAAMQALQAEQANQNTKFLQEQRARKLAQKDAADMVKAMHEIWKLAAPSSALTPQQFAVCIRQIIDYYCPDFDIPF